MEYKLFVDSDVVIDFFTDRGSYANPASELFELNEQGSVKLYLSAVKKENHNVYLGIGGNVNYFTGFALPIGIQFTPIEKFDRFSLHIEADCYFLSHALTLSEGMTGP